MRIDCERSPRLRAAVNVCVIVGLSDREERRGKEGKDRRRKALLTAQHHVSRKQGSCMEEMMRRLSGVSSSTMGTSYFGSLFPRWGVGGLRGTRTS